MRIGKCKRCGNELARGMHYNKPTKWCSVCQKNFPYTDPMEQKFMATFSKGGVL